jgi:hypothetical protein
MRNPLRMHPLGSLTGNRQMPKRTLPDRDRAHRSQPGSARVMEKSPKALLEQHDRQYRRRQAENTGDQQRRERSPTHCKLYGYEVHNILLNFFLTCISIVASALNCLIQQPGYGTKIPNRNTQIICILVLVIFMIFMRVIFLFQTITCLNDAALKVVLLRPRRVRTSYPILN